MNRSFARAAGLAGLALGAGYLWYWNATGATGAGTLPGNVAQAKSPAQSRIWYVTDGAPAAGAGPASKASTGAPAWERTPQQPGGRMLQIRVPPEVATDRLTIISGITGHGLGVGPMTAHAGKRDYWVEVSKEATIVQLLIYAPGYKVVTAEFKAGDIEPNELFEPKFEKLPTTPLKLKVVDTSGRPQINKTIEFAHGLDSHGYFGYTDGMAFGATLLRAHTDMLGEINIAMPVLPEDPYFATHREAVLGISGVSAQRDREDFKPPYIELRRRYDKPVTIVRVVRAKLAGTLHKSFLRRHKVKGDVTPYLDTKLRSPYRVEMRAVALANRGQGFGVSGTNCMLLPTGRFAVDLPAGTYDLRLAVLGKGSELVRTVTVQKNVVLKENQTRTLKIT